MEKNNPELPEGFLKKWLLATNPELTEDQITTEFGPFKDNLKWNLIRNNLIEKYEINIEVDEIRSAFQKQITSYFGANVDPEMPFVKETVDKMMQNREQVEKVYQDIMFDRLYESMEAEISVDPNPIDLEAFEKILEEQQQQNTVKELVNTEEE